VKGIGRSTFKIIQWRGTGMRTSGHILDFCQYPY
jgi:hypothetical protein